MGSFSLWSIAQKHCKTGTKDPIVVLSRLGHSITYEKVLEIETAQAKVARQLNSNSSLEQFVKVGYILCSLKQVVWYWSLSQKLVHLFRFALQKQS